VSQQQRSETEQAIAPAVPSNSSGTRGTTPLAAPATPLSHESAPTAPLDPQMPVPDAGAAEADINEALQLAPDPGAAEADINEALQLALADMAAEQDNTPDAAPDDDELLVLASPTQHTPEVSEEAPPADPPTPRERGSDTAPLDEHRLQTFDDELLTHYRTTAPVPPIVPRAPGSPALDTAQLPSLDQGQLAQRGLAFAVLRDIGRQRRENQDSGFGMLASLPREGADLPLGLFVVADGMGGHEAGGLASRLAVHAVAESVVSQFMLPVMEDNTTTVLQTLMIEAVQYANQVIWEYAQQHGTDMGTTCTAALLVGRALYVAHVGDSRAYLLEHGQLQQITTDHSMVARFVELGQITPEQAHTHPQRNQLYRAIGQQPDVVVDFVYQPIGMASHLLLCSDGLWGMLTEAQLTHIMQHTIWPQDTCRELIARANLAGGEDNITAIVVTFPVAERVTL